MYIISTNKRSTRIIQIFGFIIFTFCIIQNGLQAQVTINPEASVILAAESTDKGLRTPRMTSTDRVDIPAPAEGLLVYDITTSSFWYFGGSWIEIGDSIPSDADDDTKIWVHDAPDGEERIKFRTANSQRMVLDEQGDLTIGWPENSTRLRLNNVSGVIPFAISEYYLAESEPRWALGRDLLGSGKAGMGFFSPFVGNLQTNGSAFGMPTPQTLSFYTSNGTSLVERMRVNGNGSIGIGTSSPNPSAILDLQSTEKGLLPPRMTYDQIDMIVSPAMGLIVYCTDCRNGGGDMMQFNGDGWFDFVGEETITPAYQLGQDIDGEAINDQSGEVSLSADGNRVAIGASNNSGSFPGAGHVRVYQWEENAWVQLGQDIDGEGFSYACGSAVSLSSDGNRLAIGAPTNSEVAFSAGQVRIYEWNGNSWNQLGTDINGQFQQDLTGTSVSISADGDRVAIGSPGAGGSLSGAVRIHEWNGSMWNQLGADIIGEANFDFSGESLSISSNGNQVAIGATGNDGNGSDSGNVRIYGWDGNGWVQLGSNINGESMDDESGESVVLSADGFRVAIGATGNTSNTGHVRIYQYSGGNNSWNQLGEDIDGDAIDDQSGEVSLSGNGLVVAVGARNNDSNGIGSGNVRLYEWTGSDWVLKEVIIGETVGDLSGGSISLSADGKRVSIGAKLNDGNGLNNSGHVRVYDRF